MAVRNFGIEHFYGDALFRDSLKSFTPEPVGKNLAFLEEFEAFKSAFGTLNEQSRIIRYTVLYNKYFSNEALKELEISEGVRNGIPQLTQNNLNSALEQFVKSSDVKREIEAFVTPALSSFSGALMDREDVTAVQQSVIADFKQAWQDRKKRLEGMVDKCKNLEDFENV